MRSHFQIWAVVSRSCALRNPYCLAEPFNMAHSMSSLGSRLPASRQLPSSLALPPGAPTRHCVQARAVHAQPISCTAQPSARAATLPEEASTQASRRQILQAAGSVVLSWQLASPSLASGGTVYLDVKLEGKPLGRVEIELFDDLAVGSARFRDLAVGKEGVGFRLARFDRILPSYIRCEGVKSLSYTADGESPITGGASLDGLEKELASQQRSHAEGGLVSLIVGEEKERVVTEKLIARGGKLVTVTQQAGEAPNGTSFVITRASDPSLDATCLIVGRVKSGMDVVEAIGSLPFAKPRDSYYDGPFFSVAKAIGDKRADTAEKGFNRPLKRVIVSGGGLV